jgi:antitoxin component YwqK of YwqJK toxin-antitoxin module
LLCNPVMTRLIFLFALPVFLAACNSGAEPATEPTEEAIDSAYCACSELVFSEPYNHMYRFDKRKGYTGKCEEFYPDGQLKESKNFVDGKLHGKVFSYHKNGKVKEEKEYDMNFQVGEMIMFTSKGEVKYHALYERGKQVKVLVTRPDLPMEDEWESN